MGDTAGFERQLGRPPRDVPDAVSRLVTYCYRTGKKVRIDPPDGTNREDVNAFRLDVAACARGLNKRMTVQIDGWRAGSQRSIRIDRRRDMAKWDQLEYLTIRIYLPGAGSLRP